ncbi:MAG TPA: hypothetical protein VIC07_03320 [Acidimicrobiia bacterium]|jgi:hypothetical protein
MGIDPELVERECRQLQLMLDRIDRFRSGHLGIGPVISDLEALLYELQLADEPWRSEFIEGWSDLEIPYAVALDRQQEIPTVQDSTVKEGINRIVALVEARLNELGS